MDVCWNLVSHCESKQSKIQRGISSKNSYPTCIIILVSQLHHKTINMELMFMSVYEHIRVHKSSILAWEMLVKGKILNLPLSMQVSVNCLLLTIVCTIYIYIYISYIEVAINTQISIWVSFPSYKNWRGTIKFIPHKNLLCHCSSTSWKEHSWYTHTNCSTG